MTRKSAAPARLPITLPTTLGVASGGVESRVFSAPAAPAAVVAAGTGAPLVFAGPSPPLPPADVQADGSDDEVIDICVDSWVDENCDEDDTDNVETTDEVLFKVEVGAADSSEPENVRWGTKILTLTQDLLDAVELMPSEEGNTEGVMELMELMELTLDVCTDIDVDVDESGTGGLDDEVPAVGTPDGNGYAGTVRSLGNGGTAGTEGSTTVGTACAATIPGIEVGSPGVEVASPMTLPLVSTVATTSTTTVKTFEGSTAARRWNMRCACPMTARPFCSRFNSGSSTWSRDSNSSWSFCSCSSFDNTSWARWR
jgi:hypothetical protein